MKTGIPRKFVDADFDLIPKSAAKDKMQVWLDSDDLRKEGVGLVLTGDNGSGKTYSGIALLKKVQKNLDISKNLLYKVCYVEDLKALFAGDSDSLKRIGSVDSLRKVPYLLLDELGKGYSTDKRFLEQNLLTLLRYRVHYCRPTLITTNCTPDDLMHIYGKSFYGLLVESCYFIEVPKIINFRNEKKKELDQIFKDRLGQ